MNLFCLPKGGFSLEWLKGNCKVIPGFLFCLIFVCATEIILLSLKAYAIISINAVIALGECRDHQSLSPLLFSPTSTQLTL